jgi:hypothetical protein
MRCRPNWPRTPSTPPLLLLLESSVHQGRPSGQPLTDLAEQHHEQSGNGRVGAVLTRVGEYSQQRSGSMAEAQSHET